MKTNISIIALAAGLAAGASTASAAGQLGERFIGISYVRVELDDDSLDVANGGALRVNMPLTKNVDLTGSFSFFESDTHVNLGGGYSLDLDLEAKEVYFGATFHFAGTKAKPYVRPSLGWTWAKGTSGYSSHRLSEASYDIEAGAEIPLGDKVSITPFVGWSDAFDSDYDGTFRYGVVADIDITKSLGVVLGVTGDNDDDLTYGIGAILRF